MHRLLLGRGRRRSDNGDVRAQAARLSHDPLGKVFFGRVDQDVAAERFGLRQTDFVQLGQDDLTGTEAASHAGVHQPQRPGAQNQHRVALLQIALLQRIHGATDRLGQRRVLRRQGAGRFHHVAVPQRPRGNRGVLRHPARECKTHRGQIDAQVRPAPPAVETRAAGNAGGHHNPVVYGESADGVPAHLDDDARELVPHRQWGFDPRVAVLEALPVRPAHGAGVHANEQFVRAAGRRRQVLHPNIPRGVIDHGLHALFPFLRRTNRFGKWRTVGVSPPVFRKFCPRGSKEPVGSRPPFAEVGPCATPLLCRALRPAQTCSSIAYGLRYSRLNSFMASSLPTTFSVWRSITSFWPPSR